jgi:hypothetical protein
VIPVTIRATGTVSKSFKKYLNNIPRKNKIKELQKQPCWALRKVLLCEYGTFSMGNNITWTIYCNHSIAATLDGVET